MKPNKPQPIERPIIFGPEMIQAILTGNKTQTRRIVKLPKWSTDDWGDFELDDDGRAMIICENTSCLAEIRCPYGKPGDLLWGRETWKTEGRFDNLRPGDIPVHSNVYYPADDSCSVNNMGFFWGKTRPSIFMPRWASRILLRVEEIRVERVQDISREDAIAEGIEHNWLGDDCPPEYQDEWRNYLDYWLEESFPCFSAIESFQTLWDSINKDRGYGWNVNPWVWAVTFSRAEPGQIIKADEAALANALAA